MACMGIIIQKRIKIIRQELIIKMFRQWRLGKCFSQSLGYLYKKGKGIFLNIKVKPQASKTIVRGYNRDELLIDLQQPAENDKANQQLVSYLSELGIESRIVSGHTSRRKVLLIEGKTKKIQQIQSTIRRIIQY